MPNQNLFSEFAPTSKAEWLARIEKDLKGRPISDLTWELPNLKISPFAHKDDILETLEPIVQHANNSWEICENVPIQLSDYKSANKGALTALMGGANSLEFYTESYPTENQLVELLKDIELDYISVYFNVSSEMANFIDFLKIFEKIAIEKGKNQALLRGGVIANISQLDNIVELVSWAENHLPLFKILSVDGGQYFKGSDNVVEELFNTLKKAQLCISTLIEKGVNIENVKSSFVFNIEIGISYFIEIAKLRAFKLLWGNLLEAYDCPPSVPSIRAFTSATTQVEDVHTNKIRVTTQAMSAVLGGVDSLCIAPSDDIKQSSSDFSRRIARNVQNLLQMESYLDRVNDPSAGSYYIESLTQQIAEAVWERFQNE